MEITEKLNKVMELVNLARSAHNAGDLDQCKELLDGLPALLKGKSDETVDNVDQP